MAIDDRIRDARLSRGMSINALAGAVGVSSTAAWNWDHGYTTPRPEMLDKIAKALKVDPNYLRTGKKNLEMGQEDEVESVRDILQDSKQRLAKTLGVNLDKISLELKVSS